jgi:hypothetical protein
MPARQRASAPAGDGAGFESPASEPVTRPVGPQVQVFVDGETESAWSADLFARAQPVSEPCNEVGSRWRGTSFRTLRQLDHFLHELRWTKMELDLVGCEKYEGRTTACPLVAIAERVTHDDVYGVRSREIEDVVVVGVLDCQDGCRDAFSFAAMAWQERSAEPPEHLDVNRDDVFDR